MLNQESDETFMRAERGAMNAQRNFVDVIAIFVAKIESSRLGEIDLVSCDGEFAPDRAPSLHVDLRSVERGFVWHFDIIDSGIFQHASRHHFGLFPKLWFIHKFLSELRWIVRRETHQIFLDPEEPEILQVHLVDGIEL